MLEFTSLTCHCNLSDVCRYLGYPSTPKEEIMEWITEVSQKLEQKAQYKAVYKVFSIEPREEGKDISLEGCTLTLTGKDIATLLEESHHCILMAVTLGREVDNWLRQLEICDMADAVIADACASSLVEEYCNYMEAEILATVKKSMGDIHFTDRFSAGYGDLPLEIQPLFCKTLNCEKQMGLTVSPSYIMSPQKSITAIIGIADSPQAMRIRGCGFCGRRDHCQYRKGGTTCGTSNL